MYVLLFDMCVCVCGVQESTGQTTRGGKSERVLVVPYDVRIPKIRVATRQSNLLQNHRILVSVDSWAPFSQYPDGHFVRSVGLIGDIETETAVLMIEHRLLRPGFSQALLAGQ